MTLPVFATVAELRAHADAVRRAGQRVALVPTLGALHEGHAALIRRGRELADQVVVSIFVNPTQFGPGEDFERYPRTLDADLGRAAAAGATSVFAPAATEIYPSGERTRVAVAGWSERLCGASRPSHFDGVSTVVTKLFCAVGPCLAVFGRKDYQQLKIVQRLVTDLLLPVEIVGHPVVREADGVALSSRNSYLSTDERGRARAIPRALSEAVARTRQGRISAGELEAQVRRELLEAELEIDYVELADPDTLEPWLGEVGPGQRCLLAIAARAGATRLIDNVVLGEDPAPLRPERAT